ncbi:MAG: alginate export family protein [Acidobacteriota bacterium]
MRILPTLLGFGMVLVACTALAQDRDPMLVHQGDRFEIRAHVQAGLNLVGEQNLFWNLADATAPDAGFDSDAGWLESYLKPGLSFARTLKGGDVFYGKVSGVVSGTLGTDAYDASDTGRVTVEEVYLGFKTTGDVSFDVSAGARELKLGTGMLIANGASSGFERGALKFGPRKAWERAVIARVSSDGLTGTLFFVDPNELVSNNTKNELAGADLRYDHPDGGFLGLTYLEVLSSGSPYPQAAPGGVGAPAILEDAREGLHALSLYARTRPFDGQLRNAFFAIDLAYQWHDDIELEAWAGRIQAGYTFTARPWSPQLTYSYQTFSGDDPDTPELERFDPLFYEGSPSAWSTGSKSSMVFINSNVRAHGLALRLQPSAQDTVTLRYAHIRVDELRSPIQFGQATRVDFGDGVPTVISGVTQAHLADDVFIEYSRIINRNTYLTAGFSVSFPGEGIESTVVGDMPDWTGGFLNVVVNF